MLKITLLLSLIVLAGCGKLGVKGELSQLEGNWAEAKLPPGCKVKMIATSQGTLAILCEDGRVFH